MAQPKLRVMSYARDLKVQTDKFVEFDRLILRQKVGREADAVIVQSPQILGDTFDEMVTNLNKLADANLAVLIVPSSERQKLDPRRN